jgi:hypothetical protein
MTRTPSILALLAAAVVAAWGCGQKPAGQTASLAPGQARSLEARVTKLEQDLKAAQARASDWEERYRKELARGQAVEKERDDLQATLKARTAERDAVQARYDGFHKSLRELVGQMEASATPHPTPAVPTVSAPTVPTSLEVLPAPKGL